MGDLKDPLSRTGVVPLSSLCIHPGKSAWVLYIDAICINYDGNALDAALIAIVAALKNSGWSRCPLKRHGITLFLLATLPEAKYDEDTGVTTCSRATRLPLQIKTIPLAVTFGIFDSCVSLGIVDPTYWLVLQPKHPSRSDYLWGTTLGNIGNRHREWKEYRTFCISSWTGFEVTRFSKYIKSVYTVGKGEEATVRQSFEWMMVHIKQISMTAVE